MNARRCRNSSLRRGGTQVRPIPRTSPGPWAFSPTTRARAAIYAKYIVEHFRTARSRCSGRTTTPARINTRIARWARRQVGMIVADKSTRSAIPRSIRRSVALHVSGADIFSFLGRRRLGAADPQGWRTRLETENSSLPHRDVGGLVAEARQALNFPRDHLDGLSEGPTDRPGTTIRPSQMARLHGQSIIPTATRPMQQPLRYVQAEAMVQVLEAVRRHADA